MRSELDGRRHFRWKRRLGPGLARAAHAGPAGLLGGCGGPQDDRRARADEEGRRPLAEGSHRDPRDRRHRGCARGREGIGKLADPWRDWATALAIAFLVLTAIATFWVHQATIGLPTFKVVRDATDLAAWTADPAAKARSAAKRIRSAITLSVIAFVLGLVGLAIIWRAPGASTPGPKVEVTAMSEDISCGELLAAGDDDEVRVRNGDGTAVTVPAGQVETITPKAAC
jgi:hypothetical protein